MKNIHFGHKWGMNWVRYNLGTAKMKANFVKNTKDPVKLAKLADSKELIVLGAVAGNIHSSRSTLADLSNFGLVRNYFDYHSYENTVLIPLAGNPSASLATIGKLSYFPSLYEAVGNNPKIKELVVRARSSYSTNELIELSAYPVLHVREAVEQNPFHDRSPDGAA